MRAYEGFRDRWDRLPKWANASLVQMDQQIQSLEARVAELQGTEVTDTKARPGSSLAWYPLPSGQEYEFDMSDEDTIGASPIQIVRRMEWNGLWLAINSKHGGLTVSPRSSNVIYVRGSED